MRKTKSTIVLLTICLIAPSIFSLPVVANQQNNRDTPIIDYLRGIEIEFKPPKIILDCGSLFFLDVNLTKRRNLLPIVFSISVFLKVEDEFEKSKITRIGLLPFVYVPPFYRKTFTISVPCFTTNDLLSNLQCIRSEEAKEFMIKKASIGVKIDRGVRWGLDGLLWRTFVNDGFKMKNWLLQYNNEVISRLFITEGSSIIRHPLNKMRISSLLSIVNSRIKDHNRFIVWEEVNVSSPIVCSKKVLFECDADNETDDKGKFIVNVSITNDLDEDVSVLVLVDIADTPFFNSLRPIMKDTLYCTGFLEVNISAHDSIKRTINCSFPSGGFFRKWYTLTIECAPYIPIGDISQFGILFFDIRWSMLIKPNYMVDGYVQSLIRKVWYNLPILFAGPESKLVVSAVHQEIFYRGETPEDVVVEVVGKLGKEVKSWITLYFFYTLLLIGFACIGYWIVRKKS